MRRTGHEKCDNSVRPATNGLDEAPAPRTRQGDAINLRQLRYFVKIVEVGSMTRAAEQLFVAQPALGAQIKALEESIGVEVLVRHSRGVAPTRTGRLIYARAQQILRLVDETLLDAKALNSPERASVQLGLSTAIMTPVGREVIIEAHNAIPGMQLGLREEPSAVLIEALERDELDIAVAFDVAESPGLQRVPLAEEDLLFVTAAHEAPAEVEVSFAQAIAHPLVLQTGRDVLRLQVTTMANRLALPLDIAYDVASNTVIKDLIARGGVATIMHYGTIVDELRAGLLAARRIVNPTLKRTLFLARRLDRRRCGLEDELLDLLGRQLLRFAEQSDGTLRPLSALKVPLARALDAGVAMEPVD